MYTMDKLFWKMSENDLKNISSEVTFTEWKSPSQMLFW